MLTFNCPHCDHAMQVPESAAGKSGKCKRCQKRVIAPAWVPAEEEERAETEPEGEYDDIDAPVESGSDLRKGANWLIIKFAVFMGHVGCLAWMLFVLIITDVTLYETSSFLLAMIIYLVSLATLAGSYYGMTKVINKKLAYAIGVFSAMLLFNVARTDTYRTWDNSNENMHKTFIYSRWKRMPVGVGLRYYENDEIAWAATGKVSESGKRHGEWETTYYEPYDVTTAWFWYGDEVTEGEFRRYQNGE